MQMHPGSIQQKHKTLLAKTDPTYVCIYVYMCVHIHNTYVYLYLYLYLNLHLYLYLYIYISTIVQKCLRRYRPVSCSYNALVATFQLSTGS